jgi:hypothetical protein
MADPTEFPDDDFLSQFAPPSFAAHNRKTAEASQEETIVRTVARCARDADRVLELCRAAHRARTGEPGLALADLRAPGVDLPVVLAGGRPAVQTLPRVVRALETTSLYRLWCQRDEEDAAFRPAGSRALVFRWHQGWGGELWALTDADWIDAPPQVRLVDRDDFSLYLLEELVKHIGWWAVV